MTPSQPSQAPRPLFFTERGYARFSAFGDDALAASHGDSELEHATCLTVTASDALSRPTAAAAALPRTKHLTQLLLEGIETDDKAVQLRIENAARRLSSLTIAEHKAYLALLQQRIHAQRVRLSVCRCLHRLLFLRVSVVFGVCAGANQQPLPFIVSLTLSLSLTRSLTHVLRWTWQSGIPAILALGPHDMGRWKNLDKRVASEQVSLERDLKAVFQGAFGPSLTAVPASVEAWVRSKRVCMFVDVVTIGYGCVSTHTHTSSMTTLDERYAMYLTDPVALVLTHSHSLTYPTLPLGYACLQYAHVLLQSRNDVVQMYPQWFEPALRIERAVSGDAGASAADGVCMMKHVKEVYRYGQCPVVQDAHFTADMALESDAFEFDAVRDAPFVARHAISADVHAERLMDQYDCDVAIASSTLVALFDAAQHSAHRASGGTKVHRVSVSE